MWITDVLWLKKQMSPKINEMKALIILLAIFLIVTLLVK